MFDFTKGKIRVGNYVFVVKRINDYNDIIIGKIVDIIGSGCRVQGTRIHPLGLIQRIKDGRAAGRPREVLLNPNPDNCIFMLIDKIDSSFFDDIVDESYDKISWINENRFFVLEGWIMEGLPDMFADYFYSYSQEDKQQARAMLLEKMNSIYEKDLKDHLYAVLRSSRIL